MSWENLQLESESKDKLEFMKFPEGRSVLRIVSSPFARTGHWIPQAKVSVECIGNGCPICEIRRQAKDAGEDAQYNKRNTWMFWAIDRADGVFKIVDQGKTFMSGIQSMREDLIEDDKNADVTAFDIQIRRKGTDAQNTSYTFTAKEVEPLTDAEKTTIASLKPLKDIPLRLEANQIVELLAGKELKEIFSEQNSDSSTEVDFTKG